MYSHDVDVNCAQVLQTLADFYQREFGVNYSQDYFRTLLQPEISTLHYRWKRGLLEPKPRKDGDAASIQKPWNGSERPSNSWEKELQFEWGKDDCLELRFFHRHPVFREAFVDTGERCFFFDSATPMKGVSRSKVLRNRLGSALKGVVEGFSEVIADALSPLYLEAFELLSERVSQVETPKVVLASAHGIYRPLCLYILATLKSRGCPIVVLQPGMLHTQIHYFHQMAYESYLASIYLGWGARSGTVDREKFLPFGTFYREGVVRSTPESGVTLVVLPQIPPWPKPLSCFWSGYEVEETLQRWRKSVEALEKVPGVMFRCKSSDTETYSQWTDKLIKADINEGDRFVSYERIVVMYPSTAVVEGLCRCEKIVLHYNPSDILLTEESVADYKELAQTGGYLGDPLAVADELQAGGGLACEADWAQTYLERYGRRIAPNDAADQISSIVDSDL